MEEISTPGRVAEPGEGITEHELALAARNHGMPLEAMRYDVTPPGLHYLLIHYDIPLISLGGWRLRVAGQELDMPALQAFPAHTVRVTMECAGNGRARLEPRPVSQPWLVEAVGTADWTGVPLHLVLEQVGIPADAVEVIFTGADHGIERGVEQDYQRSLPIEEALHPDVILAYAMNGTPLPPQHGFPLRLVAPGWYGMAHVKWLTDITFTDRPFEGFQQATAYRYRQTTEDPGDPVTRIAPRALLIPPGFPDFMSRARIVRPGTVVVQGRAWSGRAPIATVDVSVDGGQTWAPATLGADEHRWAWRPWSFTWEATPGRYWLTARATTIDGEVQPVDQAWNRGGFANNAAQQVTVWCG